MKSMNESTKKEKEAYVLMLVNEPRLKCTVQNGGGHAGQQSAEQKYVKVVEML